MAPPLEGATPAPIIVVARITTLPRKGVVKMSDKIDASVASCTCGGACCGTGGATLVDSFDPARIPGWVLGVASTPAGIAPQGCHGLALG